MKTNKIFCQILAIMVIMSFSPVSWAEAMPTNPKDGKPPVGSKPTVESLADQVLYQRAFEAVLWSMPMVQIYQQFREAIAHGAKPNTILAFSKVATPNAELLTANNVTPYIFSYTDLRKGPAVIDVPKATDKVNLFGQIVDHWQLTIADIGPVGVDKGEGAKILLTPPGYTEEIPAGYLEVKSPSYRIFLIFRSIPAPEASDEDAYAYSKTLKVYYLADPKPAEFMDPSTMRYSTLARYDERWFDDLYQVINVENAYPRDKVMTGMLATIGIEKGKPYNPDEKTKKIFRKAASDAYFYLIEKFSNDIEPEELWWGNGNNWRNYLFTDANDGFEWETDDMIEIDQRALRPWFTGIVIPRKMAERPATMYTYTMKDDDGKQMEAGKIYSLTVPKDVPVEKFWSLTVYDQETFAFIYSKEGRVGISSRQLDTLKMNHDGSVTLYVGPKAPVGLESNWIPTAGKKPYLCFRFYGPTEPFFGKSFVLPNTKLMN